MCVCELLQSPPTYAGILKCITLVASSSIPVYHSQYYLYCLKGRLSPFSVTDVKHARRFTNIPAIRHHNLGAGTEWSCETNFCGRTVNGGSVAFTSEVPRLHVGIIQAMDVKRRWSGGIQLYLAFRSWRYERASKRGQV